MAREIFSKKNYYIIQDKKCILGKIFCKKIMKLHLHAIGKTDEKCKWYKTSSSSEECIYPNSITFLKKDS